MRSNLEIHFVKRKEVINSMLSFKPIHENHVMSDTMYLLVIIPPAQIVSVKIP